MSRAKSSKLKDTVNTMVDQLSSFAAEVTRVRARGLAPKAIWADRLTCRACPGVWKDLTDKRELHGEQSDQSGPRHCAGRHSGCARRP